MKRIISKIDYDMQLLAKVDLNLALDLWKKIKDKKFIIEGAMEIVEDMNSKKKTLFAPAICHMILSNPNDIDKELYNELLINLLKNRDLNRLTVFNNLSFLDLILANSIEYLDDFFLQFLNAELKNNDSVNMLRYVDYAEVPSEKEKIMIFKDNSLNIGLDEREIETFTNRDYIFIIDNESFNQASVLMNIIRPNLNQSKCIINTIESIYETSLKNKARIRIPKVAAR